MIDDLRAPRSATEFHASAARLYDMLANHYFRSRSLWSAKGKAIPRRLHRVDPQFAAMFAASFDTAFSSRDPGPLITLCEHALSTEGGFLFDGYRADAPADWRLNRE